MTWFKHIFQKGTSISAMLRVLFSREIKAQLDQQDPGELQVSE